MGVYCLFVHVVTLITRVRARCLPTGKRDASRPRMRSHPLLMRRTETFELYQHHHLLLHTPRKCKNSNLSSSSAKVSLPLSSLYLAIPKTRIQQQQQQHAVAYLQTTRGDVSFGRPVNPTGCGARNSKASVYRSSSPTA